MTREEKINLLNELLEYEEKNDIGILTRADRREFQQWVNEALEQEPFINKPCVSEKACEHDKNEMLDKIRAEIESIEHYGTNNGHDFWLRTPDEIKKDTLAILDKYKAETEN